ncbi:MAG: hypothetical protein CM15mV41_0010 [Caudoviricetes sp.]|nr:MAG: hypothetical protein CM15mV41_0010 [Caudoviricetes sp.]
MTFLLEIILFPLGSTLVDLRVTKRTQKTELKVMSSEGKQTKIKKQTPSLDSVYDDLLDAGNEIGPDVTDMLWAPKKKQALRDSRNVRNNNFQHSLDKYKVGNNLPNRSS